MRNSLILGHCCSETTHPTIPPESAMTAETAVTIENAVSKAYGNSAPGNAITFVRIQSTMLANSPRVPARKPAAAPRMNPFFTITPATSPAIKGPTCGRAVLRIRLMRNPTPIPRRRSAVLSSAGPDGFLSMESSDSQRPFPLQFNDILHVTSSETIWLHWLARESGEGIEGSGL